MKIANESLRISALKDTVEHCLKSGMSGSEVLELCKLEVFGAARLRAAIQECLAPDKLIKMSLYDQTVDKKITNEDILATVNHAVNV
jgi:hypothetical protein